MTTYTVAAQRREHGWELHIAGIGVTRSSARATAQQPIRDYIETITDRDASGDDVVITAEPAGRADPLNERAGHLDISHAVIRLPLALHQARCASSTHGTSAASGPAT